MRLVQVLQQSKDLFSRSGIQIAGGFVGEEHRRFAGECSRESDPLLFAAGKFASAMMVRALRGRLRPAVPARVFRLQPAIHRGSRAAWPTFSAAVNSGSKMVALPDEANRPLRNWASAASSRWVTLVGP